MLQSLCHLEKPSTLVCATWLPYINLLTFHTILNTCYYNGRSQWLFNVVAIHMNEQSHSFFVIWFWSRVICMGKETTYSRKLPNCTSQCSIFCSNLHLFGKLDLKTCCRSSKYMLTIWQQEANHLVERPCKILKYIR